LCDFIFSPFKFLKLLFRIREQGRDPVSRFAATTRRNQTLSFETRTAALLEPAPARYPCKTNANPNPLKTRTLMSLPIHEAIGSSRDFETITAPAETTNCHFPQIDSTNPTVSRLRIFGGWRAILQPAAAQS
jgi:hypothetical protein